MRLLVVFPDISIPKLLLRGPVKLIRVLSGQRLTLIVVFLHSLLPLLRLLLLLCGGLSLQALLPVVRKRDEGIPLLYVDVFSIQSLQTVGTVDQ